MYGPRNLLLKRLPYQTPPPTPSHSHTCTDLTCRLGQYRADILGLLLGVSELLPALATDLAQLCRPSRDAAAGFPARPGKR